MDNNGFIEICIKIDEEWLCCCVKNSSRDIHTGNLEKGASGVGLKNIEKQLELLYPNSYRLEIVNVNNVFKAELKIFIDALRQPIQ